MKQDLDILLARIDHEFTQRRNTRYWILIANDPYDNTYNFFFNIQPIGHRLHSIPLHTVTCELDELEILIEELKKHINFTIEYNGFSGMRWPKSWRIIQKEKRIGN